MARLLSKTHRPPQSGRVVVLPLPVRSSRGRKSPWVSHTHRSRSSPGDHEVPGVLSSSVRFKGTPQVPVILTPPKRGGRSSPIEEYFTDGDE